MFDNLIKDKNINKIIASLASIFILNASKRRKVRQDIKRAYRNNKNVQIIRLIKEKYSDAYCIFSRYGIGDIFFIASLLKEFKKKNGGKVVYFTEKKSLVKYLKAFPSIDEVIFDKELSFLQEDQTMQHHLQKGTLNKLFFPYRGTKETYTFSDNYNNLLDLPLDTVRELPIISDSNYKKAEQEFHAIQATPSKTVLIIPDATMFDYKIIDISFWIELANKLQEQGYDVVFNSKLKIFKKFKTTFLPIMDFLAFAQQSKYIISFRSGISDLLAGVNITNMTAIYPPNLEVIWADAVTFHNLHKHHIQKYDTEMDNMFNIHSLNATYKTNKINEIIYNYDFEYLIKNILEHINE